MVHGDLRGVRRCSHVLLPALTTSQGNILVSAGGEPCICDFGLSRMMCEATNLTTSSEVAGSLPWMAPELVSQSIATELSGATFLLTPKVC